MRWIRTSTSIGVTHGPHREAGECPFRLSSPGLDGSRVVDSTSSVLTIRPQANGAFDIHAGCIRGHVGKGALRRPRARSASLGAEARTSSFVIVVPTAVVLPHWFGSRPYRTNDVDTERRDRFRTKGPLASDA